MSFSLAYRVVEGERPEKTAFVLHGILGAGNNFTSFVQKLARRRPELRFLLVDLRNHGGSTGAAPPHTLAACAEGIRTGQAMSGVPLWRLLNVIRWSELLGVQFE